MESTQLNVAMENKLANGSFEGSMPPSHSNTTALLPLRVVIASPKRSEQRAKSVIISAWLTLERGWMITDRKMTSEKSHCAVYKAAV